MIGEREDMANETEYGTLNMRSYDIDGNAINAFYDDSDDLVFVLDNTINQNKPNVLLVINPMGDKKWDEILSGEYGVDLETIRPKQDNKYQKLDIEYSGLSVYENLINSYIAGDDLSEHLNQLNILRDSAARHSAMIRLNVANETIAKTNITIVKTKETIVRLQERVKTLRAKLSAQKKEIGKVPTKQSASKILKLESQIDATNEKLKRAKKRLDSAQKRLEVATVDAELASDLLNQPALEIQQNPKPSKSVMVAPKYEVEKFEPAKDESDDYDFDDDEEIEEEITDSDTESVDKEVDDEDDDVNADSDIKPLFDKDPEILNEDIAFKPITFDAPSLNITAPEEKEPVFNSENISEDVPEIETETPIFTPRLEEEPKPVLESMVPVREEESLPTVSEPRPVLESMTPAENIEPVIEQPKLEPQPIMNNEPQYSQPVMPVPPVVPPINSVDISVSEQNNRSKPTFLYYLLLIILIVLSVFTLWLYQKQVGKNKPLLAAVVEEKVVEEQPAPAVEEIIVPEKTQEIVQVNTEADSEPEEFVFAEDTEKPEPVEIESTAVEPVSEGTVEEAVEPVMEDDVQEELAEPVIMDSVPAQVMTSGDFVEEEPVEENIGEAVVNKPVYDVGSKNDDIVVSEQDYQDSTGLSEESDDEEYFYDYEE